MAINTFTAGTGIASAPMNSNFKIIEIKQKYLDDDFIGTYSSLNVNLSGLHPKSPVVSETPSIKITNDATYSLTSKFYRTLTNVTNCFAFWDYEIMSNIDTSTLSNAVSTDSLTGKKIVFFQYRLQAGNGGSGTSLSLLRLTDNTSSVNIQSVSATGNTLSENEGYVYLFIDWDNKKVTSHVTNVKSAVTSGVINSLTLKQTETAEHDITGFTDLFLAATNTGTTGSRLSEIFGIYEATNSPTTTVTIRASANNGSNWVSGTVSNFEGLTSGDILLTKIEANIPSTETLFVNKYILKEL